MCIRRAYLGVMAVTILLAGCSFLGDTADPVWSALSQEDAVKSGSTTPPGAPRSSPSAPERVNTIDRQPLVTIRFYGSNVPYEKALDNAVRLALERRPDVMFDLVAVAPQQDDPSQTALHSESAKRNAEKVYRSLTSAGLAPERVSLSATTSANVQTDEVQIYVR
jgi:hypothetical protein